MPDFRIQPSFPIASVIDAAQRNNQLQEQATQAGNKSLLEGLQSIGEVGQSLFDTKKRVAQSLALKNALLPNMPDEAARTMDPEQIIHAATITHKTADIDQLWEMIRRSMLPKGSDSAAPAPSAPAAPAAPATPQPGASLPINHSADLASISPTIPSPPQVSPSPMPFGGASTTTAPSPVPVPIAAPPINRMVNPATISLAKSLGLFPAKRENVFQYTPGKGLEKVGEKNQGDQLITSQPKADTSEIGSPAYTKNQQRLEQQYTNLKAKALSNRSGGLGLEDSKVDTAIHLRKSINQQYDPKTGQYNIPPSLHSEYVLGLARLMSPNGQVAVDTMNQLRQRTAREGAANVLISMGFNPEEVGGTTQSVAKFFVKQIDRQGQTAEENRQGYMDYIHGQAPVDLEPARIAAHDKTGLNSFSDLLAKSPDHQAPTGLEYSDPQKEKRYQEFKARQK